MHIFPSLVWKGCFETGTLGPAWWGLWFTCFLWLCQRSPRENLLSFSCKTCGRTDPFCTGMYRKDFVPHIFPSFSSEKPRATDRGQLFELINDLLKT